MYPQIQGYQGPFPADVNYQAPYYLDPNNAIIDAAQLAATLVQPQQVQQPMYPQQQLQQTQQVQQPMYPQQQLQQTQQVQQPMYQQPQQQMQQPQQPLNANGMWQGNAAMPNTHVNHEVPSDEFLDDVVLDYAPVHAPVQQPPMQQVLEPQQQAPLSEYPINAKVSGCQLAHDATISTVVAKTDSMGNVTHYYEGDTKMQESSHIEAEGYVIEPSFTPVQDVVDSSGKESVDIAQPLHVEKKLVIGCETHVAGGLILGSHARNANHRTCAALVSITSPVMALDEELTKLMLTVPNDAKEGALWFNTLQGVGFEEGSRGAKLLRYVDTLLLAEANDIIGVNVGLDVHSDDTYASDAVDLRECAESAGMGAMYTAGISDVFKYKLNAVMDSLLDNDKRTYLQLHESALMCFVDTNELDGDVQPGYLAHDLFPEVRAACCHAADALRSLDVPRSWFYVTNGDGVVLKIRRDQTMSEQVAMYKIVRVYSNK